MLAAVRCGAVNSLAINRDYPGLAVSLGAEFNRPNRDGPHEVRSLRWRLVGVSTLRVGSQCAVVVLAVGGVLGSRTHGWEWARSRWGSVLRWLPDAVSLMPMKPAGRRRLIHKER
jgi:hypothetical protein